MTNNFDFEFNPEFRLLSTILDDEWFGSGKGRAENKTNSAQLELGLSLAINDLGSNYGYYFP